jgi:hypothetical protein
VFWDFTFVEPVAAGICTLLGEGAIGLARRRYVAPLYFIIQSDEMLSSLIWKVYRSYWRMEICHLERIELKSVSNVRQLVEQN